MITIITEKPVRSIDIIGYGVDSYKDKNNKEIWRVYGIISPTVRGRIITKDSGVIKNLYIDDNTLIIYRSEIKQLALACKDFLDRHIAMKAPIFSIEGFKRMLEEQNNNTENSEVIDTEAVKENAD